MEMEMDQNLLEAGFLLHLVGQALEKMRNQLDREEGEWHFLSRR